MTTQSSRRVTAADVARASGVSRATVSYVLNATPGQTIPEATRERVRDAAAALGYVPNASAQTLARGSSNIVVIDLGSIPQGEVVASLAHSLARAFAARGYVPIVDLFGRGADDHAVLLTLAATVVPAAVVTLTPLPEDLRRRLRDAGVERIVALVDADGDDPVRELVGSSTRCQIEYLAARGHTSIAFAPPWDPGLATLASVRRDFAHVTARRLSISVYDMPSSPEPHDLQHLVERGITAVAAYNDEVAISLVSSALYGGIRIPDQLAVIGVDDVPLARRTYPSLTTVSWGEVHAADVDAMADEVLTGARRSSTPQPPNRVQRRESA